MAGRHGDYTGMQKAALAHQFAEEQALAARSQSLVTQVVTEERGGVVDLFNEHDHENLERAQQRASEQASEGGVVQVGVVSNDEVKQFKAVKFRASEDLDQITVGQGREFSLKAGRTYQAPFWVVQHLDNQGLVWH